MPPFNPANLIQPMKGGLGEYFSVVVLGPYGTGKSTMAGTMAKYIKEKYGKKTLLIATLPREQNSWKYKELGEDYLDCALIDDENWRPDLKDTQGMNALKATGFASALQLLEWLYTDETYGGVILDSGTEHAEQAWHAALAASGVASTSEIDGQSRWLPYERLDSMLDQSVKSLVGLTTAPIPKFVMITWHVQAPKEDTVENVGDKNNPIKVTKESSDHKAQGVEYEGDVLPMVRGKFRRKLGSNVDAMIFTELKNEKKFDGKSIVEDVQYVVQVRANPERHSKIPGPMPSVSHIPNDFEHLVAVLRNEYKPVERDEQAVSATSLQFSRKK